MILSKKEILKRYQEAHMISKGKEDIGGVMCTVWYVWNKKDGPGGARKHIFKPKSISRDNRLKISSGYNAWESENCFCEEVEYSVITEKDCPGPRFKIGQLVKVSSEYQQDMFFVVAGIGWSSCGYIYHMDGKCSRAEQYISEVIDKERYIL